jgi:Fe-S-cluster containining protein
MQKCNITKCGAVCCTFTTLHYPIRTDEVRRYFTLHGIECVSDGESGLWLKLPLPCQAFNPETKQCRIYRKRPQACRIYPEHPSPFIPKELCLML